MSAGSVLIAGTVTLSSPQIQELAVRAEHLDAVVALVRDVDPTVGAHFQSGGQLELARTRPGFSPSQEDLASVTQFPRAAVALVCDVEVSGCIDRDACRALELPSRVGREGPLIYQGAFSVYFRTLRSVTR